MLSDLEKVRAQLDRLPIFPLPSAVLLPYEVLPLHIFEPRYRQMIADAVENERPVAITQLAPGWEGEYEGRPSVDPICGVGLISRHQPLDDGRSNILLRGVARLQIVEELPSDRLYREVRAKILDDTHSTLDGPSLAEAMESLRRILFALCATRPGPAASALAQLAARTAAPGALADIVAAALLTDLDKRQAALKMLDAGERLALAQTALAEMLVSGPAAEDSGYRN